MCRCSLHYGLWLLEQKDLDGLPWPALEGQLISSWLCALVTQGAQDEVQEMALRLSALPGVACVLPAPMSCPYVLARNLIKGVGNKFSHLEVRSLRRIRTDSLYQLPHPNLSKPPAMYPPGLECSYLNTVIGIHVCIRISSTAFQCCHVHNHSILKYLYLNTQFLYSLHP